MNSQTNPEMIRLARTSRGKHQTEVAAALGIKQPTYSKIENGQVQPSADQLQQLAVLLRYPITFFSQTDRIWGTASPHHRKRKSLSALALQELEAELNVIRLPVRRLVASVHIETPFQIEERDLDIVGSPAEAAREVRRLWRVPSGPVVSLVRLLEDAGCIIIEKPFDHDRLDAISMWGVGEAPIILGNKVFPVDRKRYSYAHELGHLVLHFSDVTENPEKEADEFASELLMPAALIRAELRGLRLGDLPDLKRRWKVSMRSLVMRARNLGEISPDQARYMFMRLNQEYGGKREPVALPAEPLTLLAELLGRHINELGYTVEELAALVSSEVEEFESRYSLQRRHLRSL